MESAGKGRMLASERTVVMKKLITAFLLATFAAISAPRPPLPPKPGPTRPPIDCKLSPKVCQTLPPGK